VDEKGNQSLNNFLRKTSLLCEALLDETGQMKIENKKDRNPVSKSGNIFNSNIVVLGGAQSISEGKEQDAVRLICYYLSLGFVGQVMERFCFYCFLLCSLFSLSIYLYLIRLHFIYYLFILFIYFFIYLCIY
jgi:hypothetical protein